MTTLELLRELQALDVKIWLDGDGLRCSAPQGVLTDDLRRRLAERKLEIQAVLSATENLKSFATVVPIQPGGSRPPLFGVPGHNGDVFCFVRLAQRLGQDQPFLGLQPPGLDGSRPPFDRIEDLAAHFTDEMRQRQPRGPYFIAGYCLGGIIAFEIARQLRAQGDEVGLLALMGSPAPSAFRLTNRMKSEAADWVRNRAKGARALMAASPAQRLERLRAKAAALGQLFTSAAASDRDPTVVFRERVQRTTVAAAMTYAPEPYPGRVLVCLPSRADERSYDRLADWEQFASEGAEMMAGPDGCRNDVMLKEPAVRVFAEYLQTCIARTAPDPAWSHPSRQQVTA